jgi:hypothetical protein
VAGSFADEPHGPGGESPETLPALIAQMPQFWPPHALELVLFSMEGTMPLSFIIWAFMSWPIQGWVQPPTCIAARMQPSYWS